MLNVIYKTVIQPHIDYCITVWGYVPDIYLDKVQRIQNRKRIITGNYDWYIRGTDFVRNKKPRGLVLCLTRWKTMTT